MKSGIYRLVNSVNGKSYVGSAVNLEKREGEHFRALRSGYHSNGHLQNAWLKYGESEFAFEILSYVRPEALLQEEQKWIDHYGWPEQLYNLRPKAESNLGVRWSPEIRQRMSVGHQNRSEETRSRMSKAHKGRLSPLKGKKRSDSFRAKIALSHLTRPAQSAETRAKRAASLKKRWELSRLSGIGLASSEAIAKRSLGNKIAWATTRRQA